jgi:hypothetical protein
VTGTHCVAKHQSLASLDSATWCLSPNFHEPGRHEETRGVSTMTLEFAPLESGCGRQAPQVFVSFLSLLLLLRLYP